MFQTALLKLFLSLELSCIFDFAFTAVLRFALNSEPFVLSAMQLILLHLYCWLM